MSTSIPTPEELRADIRARTAELRALRQLLRLAEAADAVRLARQGPDAIDSPTEQESGAGHAK